MNSLAQPARERKPRADGLRSRQTILDAAAKLATVEGLQGLSIGRLAEHIGMSKSGLYAHFGSKEELQLATVATAGEIFRDDVIRPSEGIDAPLERLEALCDAFLSHLERRVFPGGCFFVSAAAEFDTQPGPVKEQVTAFLDEWLGTLEALVAHARTEGVIDAGEDSAQLVFELDSYLLMANMSFLLSNDQLPLDRARTAFRARLVRARTNGRRDALRKGSRKARQ
jgi:AcrR family transcriptional regulator